ncbi:hypothetical protein C206_01262 [Pseudomonas putida TRO1]|uniref:Uncharacterized protein n=2 Tax=Pseudomonas putida TaxID=303 RepID=A0A1L7N7F4_PSEPU|nr:hypothetical protein C206_01262 [Pseudomonas putida TRO1]BAW21399.1 Uncharacterized protein KF715C_ch8260 [Pseudomonas putida]GLO05999.1 hypothetical protein PPUJ13061_59060 [Pseudomonas putida]
MNALWPLRECRAVSHQQWDCWRDPSWNGWISKEMVSEVKQTIEHDDSEGHFEWHSEKLGHQGDRREIHGAHQEALEEVW